MWQMKNRKSVTGKRKEAAVLKNLTLIIPDNPRWTDLSITSHDKTTDEEIREFFVPASIASLSTDAFFQGVPETLLPDSGKEKHEIQTI